MLFLWSESRPHTGEAAALDAVNGLPFVIGDPPKALLPPARMVSAEAVRLIAEKLTTKNAKELRTELLALATKE